MKTKSTIEEVLIKEKITKEQLEAAIKYIKTPQVTNTKLNLNWGQKHIKVAFFGDTHYGSLYQNQAYLDDFAKRCRKEQIDVAFHTGDITEGYDRRKGHALECSLHGADAQVNGVVRNFPEFDAPVYFISGDHDGWHYENGGFDIGKAIAFRRKDLKHLGIFQATIDISKNTKVMLMHPAKGTSYALSYHPQKIIEALSGGEKPNILAIGHFHKIEYLFYRNVHCFQTGTFQNQTNFMKRMNLSAHLGGWIADVYMKSDGTIDKLITTLIPYY